VSDLSAKSTNISDKIYDILGIDEIKGDYFYTDFIEIVHPFDKEKVRRVRNYVLSGKVKRFAEEVRIFNAKKNSFIWIDFIFAALNDEKVNNLHFVVILRDINEEKILSNDQTEFERLFKETRKVANITTFVFNTENQTFDHSDELDEFTGVKDLISLSQFRSIVLPEDLKEYDIATDYILKNPKGKSTVYRIVKDNQIQFVQSSIFGTADARGNIYKVFGILKDITEIEQSRRYNLYLQKSFQQIFNSSPAGIILLDENYEIMMENETFRKMFHISTGEMKLKDLLGEAVNRVIMSLKNSSEVKNIEVSYLIESKVHHFSCTIIRIDESFQSSYQGTVIDITERVLNQEKILFLATHDTLTSLYNRNHFENYVSTLKNHSPIGVMVCDIDGLKLINDAFGHVDGDNLLRKFALTLKKICPNAFIARIGGDEFSIIETNSSQEDMELIEQQIKEAIDDFYVYGISFEVSMGYSIWDENTIDFRECFKTAENIMYRRKLTERFSRKSNALSTIMESLHEKTEETKEHCERVGQYAALLLYEIGFRRNIDMEEIKFLSEVHDIGKIAISDTIIRKPGKLTIEEYETMKYHAEAGYKIIRNITEKEDIAYGVLYHHERWDGTGYPHGLKEEQIPLYARIIAITDAFDTMIRGRVYKTAISIDEALNEIVKCAGSQFDPELSTTFVKLIKNNE